MSERDGWSHGKCCREAALLVSGARWTRLSADAAAVAEAVVDDAPSHARKFGMRRRRTRCRAVVPDRNMHQGGLPAIAPTHPRSKDAGCFTGIPQQTEQSTHIAHPPFHERGWRCRTASVAQGETAFLGGGFESRQAQPGGGVLSHKELLRHHQKEVLYLKATVIVDAHNYPAEPPVWSLLNEDGTRGTLSSWGEGHGSISSLQQNSNNNDTKNAPPLFDAALHRIECRVNRELDGFVRQDVEATYDWILIHQ